MLTPIQQIAAIFSGLSDDQKTEAVGRYSTVAATTADDVAHLQSFFDPNVTSLTRKFIMVGTSCAALLYYEEGHFKVLSAPSMTVGPNNAAFIVGHEGDTLVHTSPVRINVDKAVLDALVLAFKPANGGAALEELMAQPKATDILVSEEDNITECEFPFPAMGEIPLATVFADAHVARLPVVIPLPMGHGIECVSMTDPGAIATMISTLQSITPMYGEWAQAFVHAANYFHEKSLTHGDLDIPQEFFAGIDSTNNLRGSIITKSSRVTATTIEGKAIYRRIDEAKKVNMDSWFTNHPDVYQNLLSAITPQVAMAPVQPAQVSPQAPKATQSRADKQDEYRVLKGKTIISLLLARHSINADGECIYVPGEIDEAFEDTLLETPRNACKEYLQLIRAKVEDMKGSPTEGALSYVMRFPWAAINVAFASAFQKGQWTDQPIQSESAALGQNLGFLTFAPSHTGSADYKRQWDETNVVLGEDMVDVDTTQRTKISVSLFKGGKIGTHSHLMATIANLYVTLKVAEKSGQASEALIFQSLKEIFSLLAQTNMRDWIERSSVRGGPGEHLPYALALEIHTSLLPLVTFATKSEMIRKVINKEDIPMSALAFYKATHAELLRRLNAACAGDNLGNYLSPPSTWVPFQKPNNKDQNKQKQQKTGGDSSTSGGGKPSSDNNRSGGTGLSTATMGMINAPTHIRNGPSLSSGQKVCLPFVRKGDTCTLGRACPNAHMTPRYSSVPDLTILDGWVTRTNGAEWAAKPAKLAAVQRSSSQSGSGTQDNPPGTSTPASGTNTDNAGATPGERI